MYVCILNLRCAVQISLICPSDRTSSIILAPESLSGQYIAGGNAKNRIPFFHRYPISSSKTFRPFFSSLILITNETVRYSEEIWYTMNGDENEA